jgi:hypothetical protein
MAGVGFIIIHDSSSVYSEALNIKSTTLNYNAYLPDLLNWLLRPEQAREKGSHLMTGGALATGAC